MLCSLSQSGSLLPSPRSYSLAVVQPRHTASSKVFHEITYSHICRLFEIAPHLRELFPFGQDPKGPQLRSHALNVNEHRGNCRGTAGPIRSARSRTQTTWPNSRILPVNSERIPGEASCSECVLLEKSARDKMDQTIWNSWETACKKTKELFMRWLIYYGVVHEVVDLLWSCL